VEVLLRVDEFDPRATFAQKGQKTVGHRASMPGWVRALDEANAEASKRASHYRLLTTDSIRFRPACRTTESAWTRVRVCWAIRAPASGMAE
jgi:hypothetical protein